MTEQTSTLQVIARWALSPMTRRSRTSSALVERRQRDEIPDQLLLLRAPAT